MGQLKQLELRCLTAVSCNMYGTVYEVVYGENTVHRRGSAYVQVTVVTCCQLYRCI